MLPRRHRTPRSFVAVVLAAVSTLASFACLHDIGEAPAPGEHSVGAETSLVLGSGEVALVSVSAGRAYENPVLLAVSAPSSVAEVVYDADGWELGASEERGSGFALRYRFQRLGVRTVRARAYDAARRVVGEAHAAIEVVATPTRQLRFTTPAEEGGWYRNDVWFKVEVQGAPVDEVRYFADGVELGRSSDAPREWAIRYRFTQLGPRLVRADALDHRGQVVASATRRLVVTEPSADTPYYYQYANALAPASTCQNTAIAMVLASLGWRGVPDDITAEFGRFEAQSPAGLAGLFNRLAVRSDIASRLTPRTDGTLDELQDEVRAGRPVIAHGYFTGFGHVLVVLGYDGASYIVNDPAGTWNQRFQGGYPNGWEPTAGRRIRYPAAAFERAIASFDGSIIEDGSLWYHLLR